MREWKTGFAERYVAPTLSQYITGGVGNVRCISVRSEHIHRTSDAVFATALYSASVEDLATLLCFLEDQDIGFRPM